jgi:hypothetical protein
MFSAALENIAYFLHFPVEASDTVLYVKKRKIKINFPKTTKKRKKKLAKVTLSI